MELSSSDKERIQHQYDALAKKTLVGEAKSYRRTLAKRAAREVTFSDLSESELAQLFTTDEYESDYYRFQVSGFDVLVKNELLAEVLNALPERKRDIVLLSYFLDMSDAEIGELLNVVRTTVFRRTVHHVIPHGPRIRIARIMPAEHHDASESIHFVISPSFLSSSFVVGSPSARLISPVNVNVIS